MADLEPWKPTAADPWDLAKASHLLRRAGFGARPEEVEVVLAMGHDRAIDALLVSPHHHVPTHGTHDLPTGEVLNISRINDQRGMLLHTQATTAYPLKEKMTAFWLDHFSVGLDSTVYPEPMGRHTALLRWLDNSLSTTKKPNENYARELLELYTVGVFGGYTESDIKEAARALTRHRLRGYTEYYFADNGVYHDYAYKTVFGRNIYNPYPNGAKDLDDLVDIILAQPATAAFMVGKIWEYFVYPEPAKALVDNLAGLFVKDGFNLRSLMSIILRSRAFFSAAAYRKRVKDPLDYSVGLVRTLDAKVNYSGMGQLVVNQGYPLLNFANPAGLEDGIAWITSQSLIERANYAQAITQGKGSTKLKATIDPTREIRRAGLKNDVQVVDHYLKYMVDGQVPAGVRTSLIHYMNTIDSGTRTFDINNPTHVDQKVRGLIHLIGILPEYQMK